MLAKKYNKNFLLIIFMIQTLKSIIKLYILFKSKGHYFLEQTTLPNDQLLREEKKILEVEQEEK
jgi:hypothetical protein